MAKPIITAVRNLPLKESVLHTLIELAHRSSIYGIVRDCSLSYLARKCHCCKQTIINHIKKLIELKILSKNVIWIKGNLCEINTYRFLIPWQKPPAQMSRSQNSGPKFPEPEEREKKGRLGEKIRQLERSVTICGLTPGTIAYEATIEEIMKLKTLMGTDVLQESGL
jgi:hypothetical protein